MAQILPITPSLINTFKTCPLQYKAKYITKEVVFQQNEAAAYGDRIHKAVEAALKHNAALTPEASYMQPLVNWVKAYAAMPGVDMFVEERMGVTHVDQPCGWRDKNVRYRGIMDVFLIDHNKHLNVNIDWKTGKPKDDQTQANILSMCATRRTGYVNNLNMWVFANHDKIIHNKVKLDSLIPVQNTLADFTAYERACRNDEFPATPNGLCGKWCDVMSCQYNGRKPASTTTAPMGVPLGSIK